MNHYKKILYSISFLAPFLICAVPIKVTTYDITSSVIGPFKKNQIKENIVLSVTTNSLIDRPVIGRLCIYDINNNLMSMSKSPLTYISKYSPIKLSFAMNFPNGLDENGFIIDFDLLDDNVIKWTSKATIKLNSATNIDVLENKNYKTPVTAFYFKGKRIITLSEEYNFDNIYDYFPADYYQKIDLSKFSFKYNYSKDFTYADATLYIYDEHNIFTNMQHDDDVLLRVPLKITQADGDYHFSYGCNLYVDPITFDMSFSFLPNYKKTNNFYLPINKKKEILDTTFEIGLYDCGDNHISFYWELDYLVNTNIVGNCYESAYCIIGGVKQ